MSQHPGWIRVRLGSISRPAVEGLPAGSAKAHLLPPAPPPLPAPHPAPHSHRPEPVPVATGAGHQPRLHHPHHHPPTELQNLRALPRPHPAAGERARSRVVWGSAASGRCATACALRLSSALSTRLQTERVTATHSCCRPAASCTRDRPAPPSHFSPATVRHAAPAEHRLHTLNGAAVKWGH